MAVSVQTLVLIQNDTQLLLGLKKRGFGAGRWNGYGGKVQTGETIEEAAYREFLEETGVHAGDLKKIGTLKFYFVDSEDSIETHVFHGTKLLGEPIETEEMKPQWFHIDEIPYSKMWPDDLHWYPLMLEGKRFEGEFTFSKSGTIERFILNPIDD